MMQRAESEGDAYVSNMERAWYALEEEQAERFEGRFTERPFRTQLERSGLAMGDRECSALGLLNDLLHMLAEARD